MKFLLRTPFLRLLLAVVAGIGVHEVLHVPGWVVWTAGGLSVGLVAVSRCIRAVDLRYRFRWLFGCGVGLFFMVLSYVLCAWQEQRQAFDHVGEPGIFEVEVERLPVEKARSYLVEVRVRRFADSLAVRASRGRGYVYLEKDSAVLALAPGDRLLLEACFAPPASLNNPGGFDYARYLRRKGIGATAYVPGDSWRMAGRVEGFTIMGLAQQCQRRLVDVFRRFDFSPENFGVLAALSFGYVDELDPDLREQYNVTGITHILAVSGMHVGIIYFLLDFLLRFLDRSRPLRRVKAVVILLLIWSYAFITGLPPSAFRATLMFSLVAVGRMFGGRSSVYNTLSMSAFFMLLVNPSLLFHVGFQLSYAAVVGIVYLQPRLYRLLSPRNRPARWLWSLLTVSVAAQVGTMPLTLYYFQTFPNYFLLTNLVAIPASTLVLYGAVCLLLVAGVPGLSVAVAWLLDGLLTVMNGSVGLIQQLPAPVSVVAFTGWQSMLFVLALCLLCYYARVRRYPALVGGMCCVIGIFLINAGIRHDTARTQQLIVYASYRDTHVNFITGNRHYVYTNNPDELYKTAGDYWNNRRLGRPMLLNAVGQSGDVCTTFRGYTVLIPGADFYNRHVASSPLDVDLLILGNGLKPRAEDLFACIRPRCVVADYTITPWYARQLAGHCRERGITFHSVREQGAFVWKGERVYL